MYYCSMAKCFHRRKTNLDPVLVANELVEDYRAKKKKGSLLKIDLEKAFDQVDWDFLEKTMRSKKFNDKWIEWIKGSVKNPRFSFH